MELDCREPTINTPQHLLQQLHGINDKEAFWFEECRNWMRRYDTTRHGGTHAIVWVHDILD
jgi:hypothetical protein